MSDERLASILTEASKTSNLEQLITTLAKEYGTKTIENILYPIPDNEPLLNPENQRFTAFPIKYPILWDLYQLQMASMWTAGEVDFSADYDDFQTLNPDVQHFIESILAFFAASDGIVNFNIGERFLHDVQITEAQMTYRFQMMMEDVHSHVYSLMLENIVRDVDKREHLFNAIETIPSVKMMADWAFKWVSSTESFAHRLIAFAIVEGVFFSGAFAAIFWIKNHFSRASGGGVFMKGLMTSNSFIARDEGRHCVFACELYKMLNKKLLKDEVYLIIDDAVGISKQFMNDALPVRLIGMNNQLMNDYIEYVSDYLLSLLQYPKRYNTANPFDFMTNIGLDNKTNFFEGRPTEYQNAHVLNKNDKNNLTLNLDDDF